MGAAPPDSVKRLVDRFDQDRRVFQSPDYKEEQLRAEFLNGPSLSARHSDLASAAPVGQCVVRTSPGPFFTALGWDMDMPSDVLGEVYEQFLGKVIRLTAGHQAKVEEKPEVRKAGELRPARLTSARRRPNMQPMSTQGRPTSAEVESSMSPEFPRRSPSYVFGRCVGRCVAALVACAITLSPSASRAADSDIPPFPKEYADGRLGLGACFANGSGLGGLYVYSRLTNLLAAEVAVGKRLFVVQAEDSSGASSSTTFYPTMASGKLQLFFTHPQTAYQGALEIALSMAEDAGLGYYGALLVQRRLSRHVNIDANIGLGQWLDVETATRNYARRRGQTGTIEVTTSSWFIAYGLGLSWVFF